MNLESPAFGTQVTPAGAREQFALPLPLIKLLSENGAVGGVVAFVGTSWVLVIE